MRIIEEEQLDFDDVAIQPKRSLLNSRSEVEIWRTLKWKSSAGNEHALTCKPVISAIMTTVGTPHMAYELATRGYLASIEKHIGPDDIHKLYCRLEDKALDEGKVRTFYTSKICLCVGLNDSLDTVKDVMKSHLVNIVHVDCPNAYIPNFKKRVAEVRSLLPEAFLMAGVVVTSDLTTDLVNLGVNCVSLGICAGSVCKTTERTAVRRPLLSMIVDCADAAHQQNAYVLISGGIRNCHDACIAFGGGCDILMTGSLLAGTDEADGEVVEKKYLTNELDNDGRQVVAVKKFKKYFGMASKHAMKLYNVDGSYKTDEGRMKLVPYVGPLDGVLQQLEGGLKSMMCFIGARSLKEVPKKTTFYKVHHGLNDKFLNCEDFN